MPRKKVNIRDVAAACGYSIYTVSLVLNDKPGVSDTTRARVQQAIRQTGYDPLGNMPLAKSLNARTIGLVLPEIGCEGHRFYYRAISQTRNFASQHGWDIKLFSQQDLQARMNDNLKKSRSLGFDSLIVFCCEPPMGCIERILDKSIPVSVIRRDMKAKALLKITDDDLQGISLALEHLHKVHNHSRIAVVASQFATPPALKRKTACLQYAAQNALEMDEQKSFLELDARGPALLDDIYTKTTGNKISALLCFDDELAAMVAKHLMARGVKIPQQLAIIGYNNDQIADMFHPGITSVNVPVEQMIAAACNSLLHHDRNLSAASTEMRFENSLIIRQSCGCGI